MKGLTLKELVAHHTRILNEQSKALKNATKEENDELKNHLYKKADILDHQEVLILKLIDEAKNKEN